MPTNFSSIALTELKPGLRTACVRPAVRQIFSLDSAASCGFCCLKAMLFVRSSPLRLPEDMRRNSDVGVLRDAGACTFGVATWLLSITTAFFPWPL